jgi:hypothetical protein
MSHKKGQPPRRWPTAEEYLRERAIPVPIPVGARVICSGEGFEERGYVVTWDPPSETYVVKVDAAYLEMGEYCYDDGLREVHRDQIKRESAS